MLLVVPRRSLLMALENRAFCRWAKRVTSENSPKSAGVVLCIAISDHCRCVSNPRCRRTSWKVASICQRLTNQERIFCGSASRSVHRRAWVLNSPLGSRTKTQRRGTANKPVLYQTAVLEAISTMRSPLPYHLAILAGFQTVFGSSATPERFGRRSPLRRGLPPLRRGLPPLRRGLPI